MHAPTAPSGNDPLLGRAEFSVIADIMMADARIKLTEGKMTLVHARLSRRLREHGLGTFKEYVRLVQSNADERALLVTSLTTNHTHFFRENHHFEHLRQQVIPSLKEKARVGPVRLWSAGCSSGEEVYTVAMCLLGTDRSSSSWLKNANVKLLATDIAPPVVQATANALYTTQVAEGVPEPYKKLWMRDVVGGFQMADEARELVTAKVLNLFDPWPMRQQYDVIFCRNVMIYFDDDAKAELELRLVQQLAPGGYLYIGHSERLLGAAQNGMKPCGQTVYVKSAGGQL
jgi:chemotaxis protein methyltransferase CheR